MALKLNKDTDQGVSADYWRIDNVVWNKKGLCKVNLALYKDSDVARMPSSKPLEVANLTFKGSDIDSTKMVPALYSKIKESQKDETGVETNQFAVATDC